MSEEPIRPKDHAVTDSRIQAARRLVDGNVRDRNQLDRPIRVAEPPRVET